ncbi:MAG: GNAT family N-acetyltransferase [Clostridia bacterium]|jgi:GNAT superfamily N-acetyltransferase|nr:GNAT family N-acetyltransferase [Clostridia bacterium]MBT7123250.1 GNAT family N-acetyltransferase [Clostridia bacterium]
MMISDFKQKDVEQARQLALSNYNEERAALPALPAIESTPDIGEFAQNGLGVAMYEGETMLGFLCGQKFDNFGIKRVYSPEHAHGAIKQNRAKIYSRLYQAASEKWVTQKALIHSVTLYSHDETAKHSFFNNVFGACVMYAAMDISKSPNIRKCDNERYELCELTPERFGEVLPLQNKLLSHLRQAPVFLPYEKITQERFATFKGKRYFAALEDNQIIAYLRTQENAENFVTCDAGTVNITGAYMYPEHRGAGVYTGLLSFVVDTMRAEGYERISVDFETYNPNALGFWTKYFTPYTTSVTRSIEPQILNTREID